MGTESGRRGRSGHRFRSGGMPGTASAPGGRHIPPLRGGRHIPPLTLRKEPTPTPLRKEPTPAPLQHSPATPSAPAQPYALPALFLPPLTPLRGEGEIGRWALSVLPFATTLRPEILGSASLLRVAPPTAHAFSTPPTAPLRGAVS